MFFVNKKFPFLEKLKVILDEHELNLIALRELKFDESILGEMAKKSCPQILQIFVENKKRTDSSDQLDINLYKAKKLLTKNLILNANYIVALSLLILLSIRAL